LHFTPSASFHGDAYSMPDYNQKKETVNFCLTEALLYVFSYKNMADITKDFNGRTYSPGSKNSNKLEYKLNS
jgi:hypothetical protein